MNRSKKNEIVDEESKHVFRGVEIDLTRDTN